MKTLHLFDLLDTIVYHNRINLKLSIAIMLLGLLGSTSLGASQDVINTNDSGTGSLRDAVANVGVGENVVFQSVLDDKTINLNSNLDVARSMDFVNNSGGNVVVDLNGNSMSVVEGNTISIDSGLTYQTSVTGSALAITVNSANSYTINGLSGNVSASAYGDAQSDLAFAYAFRADDGDLNITNGLSGNVLASTTGYAAIGLNAADTISISGGLSGTVSAVETGSSRVVGTTIGLFAVNMIIVDGGLSGTVSASSGNLPSYGFFAEKGIVISDGLSGTVSANSTNGSAIGIHCTAGTINGGDPDTPLEITGSVLANGATETFAIQGHEINLRLNETGTLSAISNYGNAYAIDSSRWHYPRPGQTADDNIELVAGCTVVGDIDLGCETNGDTLTLSGTNGTTTYNGNISGVETTNVTGGTWYLNGYNFDDLTITGGTLGGSGQFGNLVNNGTLAPGNSIGILTVNGNYTQNAGSTLEIEINNAGQSDLLYISNTASINGGAVDVQAERGYYADGSTYTFLDAYNGRAGTFDSVTDSLAFFDVVLLYDINTVQMRLDKIAYNTVAQTYNQRAVADYLDNHYAGATGDFATVLAEFDTLTASEARAAFDAMSGELYGSLSTVGIESMDSFMRTLAWRLRARSMTRGLVYQATDGSMMSNLNWDDSTEIARGQEDSCEQQPWWQPNRWRSWAEGYGTGASVAGNGNASGLGYSTGGLAYGIEDDLDANTLLGFTGGYSHIFTELDDRSDRGTIDSAQVGVYLHHGNEWGYATAIAAYAHNNYDTLRHVTVGSINRTATADYDGNNFSFYLEAGRNVHGRACHFQPYAALEYIQLHQNHFLESGANSLNLSVGGVNADAFRGLLGTRLVGYYQTSHGRLVSLEGRALWRHEFLDEARVLDAQFAGQPGGAFTVNSVNVDRDAAILGCGLTFCLSDGVKLYANYALLTSENYTAHAGGGGLMLLW